jgi:phosphinothricin acetyltransferase
MSTKVNPLQLYNIREATEADLPQLLDIYNERVRNSTSLFVYDEIPLENRQTWFKDCQAKGYPVIVAAEKETDLAIAYSSLAQYRPHPAYVL